MPKKTAAEKEEAKLLRAQKKEARLAKKGTKKSTDKTSNQKTSENENGKHSNQKKNIIQDSCLVQLPGDALSHIFCFLPSKELGALCSSCREINNHLKEGRIQHLLSRLNQRLGKDNDESSIYLCEDEFEIRTILESSLTGGDTGRLITKKSQKGIGADEYPAYARFIEEAVCGYAVQNFGRDEFLPEPVNGRFLSTSPEHTVCRVGGGGDKGGGSGAACWGVGKRGQLGQGKRQDEELPTRLLGGVGYGIRIVQVSAGGGLVRVAHTLLLTSTGRVLSFGTAQYGALGHGYSPGNQLPDELRPRYIEALSRYRVTCIAAGELHSAACTDDGDIYTWGDGFCGQLGLGGKRPQLLPQHVKKGGLEDECVSSVSCGARHTICITDDGEAFTFGLGHYGALGRAYTPFEYGSEDGTITNLEPTQAEGQVPVPAAPLAPAGITLQMENHLDLLANVTLNDNSNQCIPMLIDVLKGIHLVGASAGHRHSMLLDKHGHLYTFGNGSAGELGHGNLERQNYPLKVMEFVETNTTIVRMSAGVDYCMAVCSRGNVYSWGSAKRGRLGLTSITNEGDHITIPRKVNLPIKAVDVECGYIHSMIVGVDGTIHRCGKVGINGEDDGQETDGNTSGGPIQIPNFNIWHRTSEPKKNVEKKERWKKFGKYETKGRTKMMQEAKEWN